MVKKPKVKVKVKILPQSSEEEKILSVSGIIMGQTVSGEMTMHYARGEYLGYDYYPDPGTMNVPDDDDTLQVVLDACESELGLN